MGLDGNWSEVAEEEVSSQEWLGCQTLWADAVREPSDSQSYISDDAASCSGGDTWSAGGVWWVQQLVDAAKTMGYDGPQGKKDHPHWKVISGCTGISSETWVFKARFLKGNGSTMISFFVQIIKSIIEQYDKI